MKNDTVGTVVVVTPYFPPAGGGLEQYALHIARELSGAFNWRVVIITSGNRYGADEYSERDGIFIYRLRYAIKISNTPFAFSWHRKIKKIFDKECPDIINIHMPVPGIGDIAYLRSGKKPIIVTYHSGSMHKGIIIPDLFIWLYEHCWLPFLLRHANRIICSSDWVRFNFLRPYQYKCTTVTPAVDGELFMPDPTKKSTEPEVLFVAGLSRAERYKGLATLLEAMVIVRQRVPSVTLTVVGDGDMRTDYESRAQKLEIDHCVRFTGRLQGTTLANAYQRAWLFAFPTAKDNFPLTILEAMMSGLPIVSTTVGDIPHIVNDGMSGNLVSPHDMATLADKISAILLDARQLRQFADYAHDRIRHNFDWHSRAQRYDHLFKQWLTDVPSQSKRVVVVAPYFYPKIGGLENYAYEIARRLHRSGEYRVTIVTSNHRSPKYMQETMDGMIIHRLPTWFKISNTPMNPFWYWWIKRIFASVKPDLIHVHSPVPIMADMAILAARATPVVITYHAGSMRKQRYPVDFFITAYESLFLPQLFKLTAAIVAVSPAFATNQLRRFSQKVSIVPPGVDLDRFSSDGTGMESQMVTYVGRIERSSSWKGIEQLLQAMALVHAYFPHARLELVGDGDAVDYYRARSIALGIGSLVTFAGSKKARALADVYRHSAVVVLPSLTEAESFGTVLLEAMASGSPVIGSAVGGIPFLIDNEKNGILVAPKDSAALAHAIGRILGNPELARRFSVNGISKAQHYGWDVQLLKYRSLFEQVLRKSL